MEVVHGFFVEFGQIAKLFESGSTSPGLASMTEHDRARPCTRF
ncbi:hypothetical protein AKJ08_3027 [Vulgatibacter incomptus]|uniref:Uncharacterized protein n=1 Tax=Vulgatibacter incomptus TaxID=1391653 RepID=A0A0K1PGJ1_9BACT|nr:hypothetical protein AKJ08_3027 [Vulgatibacter incomptus]